jgi:hypothetical protein
MAGDEFGPLVTCQHGSRQALAIGPDAGPTWHPNGQTGEAAGTMFKTAAVILALCICTAAAAQDRLDLYRAKAIVTGTGELNRQIGFKKCLDEVLVRVSGDQRLPKKPQMAELRDKAASFVAEFRYRDRLEGIPVHDEQGTHDRPHDLTCIYRPEIIDALLKSLGSRPWLAERPVLAVFLAATRGGKTFVLTADGEESPYMRDSFTARADPLAMRVVFPTIALLASSGLDGRNVAATDIAKLDEAARKAGAGQALAGTIVWSDKELGWIADWRLQADGKAYRWQVRGVSFDEAFRVAMKGAAQILSGNGQP